MKLFKKKKKVGTITPNIAALISINITGDAVEKLAENVKGTEEHIAQLCAEYLKALCAYFVLRVYNSEREIADQFQKGMVVMLNKHMKEISEALYAEVGKEDWMSDFEGFYLRDKVDKDFSQWAEIHHRSLSFEPYESESLLGKTTLKLHYRLLSIFGLADLSSHIIDSMPVFAQVSISLIGLDKQLDKNIKYVLGEYTP